MGVIKCSTCGYRNPKHLVGSKHEDKYMRVMDTTRKSWDKKLFFCSDHCYLDREFLREVLHKAGERWRPMRIAVALRHYTDIVHELGEHYQGITMTANKSPGLWLYRKRNNVHDPFAHLRNERGVVVEEEDVVLSGLVAVPAAVEERGGCPSGTRLIESFQRENVNWVEDTGKDGVLVL